MRFSLSRTRSIESIILRMLHSGKFELKFILFIGIKLLNLLTSFEKFQIQLLLLYFFRFVFRIIYIYIKKNC